MTDKIPAAQRSANMSRIRSRNTLPEIAVRRLIFGMGFRYRLHVSNLPGKPDIVLPRHRCIIQVHGCFWHQHRGCIDGRVPASRQSYWVPKLAQNVERDAQVVRALRRLDWRVITVWECETADHAKLARRLRKILVQAGRDQCS